MGRVSDEERREVAAKLREPFDVIGQGRYVALNGTLFGMQLLASDEGTLRAGIARLADLIEPTYKPDAEYEAWYDGLSHFGDERGGPSTIRELIEEIVWTALTVDLGPNGNTDSTGVDEGRVYTDELFAEWEREALRLSGSIDRDALLQEVKELEKCAYYFDLDFDEDEPLRDRLKEASEDFAGSAHRIRKALGVES